MARHPGAKVILGEYGQQDRRQGPRGNPKGIRDQIQLHAGDEVDVGVQEDRIIITVRRPAVGLGGRFAKSGMAARLLADRA
jgi:AbrB family looped-hinge helix DNA binding protein